MRRAIAVGFAILAGLSVFLIQAQAQFTVRAASDDAIAGWDRMEVDNHTVWVSPTVSLTSADILQAEARADANGRTAVGIVFTDAGAKKILRQRSEASWVKRH